MTIFSQEALQKLVTETLPTDAYHGDRAVVGAIDQNGAQVVASFKFREGAWELQAAAHHNWNGGDSVGAKVMLRW